MKGQILPSIDKEQIDWEKCWFNPGCAMNLYKPELAGKMLGMLREHFGDVKYHDICCHYDPKLPEGATIINNCAGCDRRFRSEYPGIRTITFWELIDGIEGVALPKQTGLTVSIHDSCSFRQKPQVHAAVRSILRKMEIGIVEAEESGMKSVCCGDNFYSHIPNEEVEAFHRRRAAQMPCDDVVVYCIGCVRSMTAGGKRPLYLPELVFGGKTEPMLKTLDEYHDELDDYIGLHTGC